MTELGSKHECISCGAKFYDLGKSEVICPKCGADQQQLAEAESDKKTPASKKRRPVAEKEAEPAAPEGEEPEDEELENDEVLADAEDLDDEEPDDEDEE